MNGDLYKRREVAPGRYQCGCRWMPAEKVPRAKALGVRGMCLVQCPIHQAHTDSLVRKFEKNSGRNRP